MLKSVPYRMVLDFDRPCPKCKHVATILITSDHPDLPSFHFCSCERPTFTLYQDEVGEIPSFARAAPGTLGLHSVTKRNNQITEAYPLEDSPWQTGMRRNSHTIGCEINMQIGGHHKHCDCQCHKH